MYIPVVGDDTVVDNGELDIRGRRVRMRVDIRRFTVSGPTSVGNAEVA